MRITNCFDLIRSSCLIIPLALTSPSWLPHYTVIAQVIPDDSLGNESSRAIPLDPQTSRIDGGALRGNSLFHSFRNFSIPEGNGVFFSNPRDVKTVFSRVTGGTPSEIYGRLGVLGTANLWLMNPNGILFGSNAQLDIKGAFVATTATSLTLPSGAKFSATNPQPLPLLEVNVSVPIGLQFEGAQPAPIVNTSLLTVEPKQNITLVGGMVVNRGSLTAPGGDLTIVAVPSPSIAGSPTVQLSQVGQYQAQILSPQPGNSPVVSAPGTALPEVLIDWSKKTALPVDSEGRLIVTESGAKAPAKSGTVIIAGSLDASNLTPSQQGGKIEVRGNQIGLVDRAQVNASATAGGGLILLGGQKQGQGSLPNADRTFVSSSSRIQANAITSGNGGKVIIWADESTRFRGTIAAQGGANLGDGGFVEISGKENLGFDGTVDVSANRGKPGTLLLDPRNITISSASSTSGVNSNLPDIFQNEFPGADINISATALENQAGNIILQATDNITVASGLSLRFVSGGSISFTADANNDGVGSFSMDKDIWTRGRSISISGASITLGEVNTSGNVVNSLAEDSGAITLNATNRNISTNKLITSSSLQTGNAGRGGDVSITAINGEITTENIETGSAVLGNDNTRNGGSAVFGDGNTRNGGNINLISSGKIITGSIRSNSQVNGNGDTGNGGNIFLNGHEISTGFIQTSTLVGNGLDGTGTGDAGNAGNIRIVSRGNFTTGILRTSSSVLKEGSSGNGGMIDIDSNGDTKIGEESGNSIISDSVSINQSSGNAGSTTINSIGKLEISGAISSFSQSTQIGNPLSNGNAWRAGNGGNITLVSSSSNISVGTLSTWSRFDGSGQAGNAGNVTLVSPKGSINSQSVNAFSTVTGNSASGTNENNTVGTGGSILFNSAKDVNTGFLTTSSLVGQDPQFSFGNLLTISGKASNAGDITLVSDIGNINFGGLASVSLLTGSGTAGKGGEVNISSLLGSINVPIDDGNGLNTFAQIGGECQAQCNQVVGGNLLLSAKEDIRINGIRTFSEILGVGTTGRAGGSGNISIISQEGKFSLQDNAKVRERLISSRALSGGNSGNIEIRTKKSIDFVNTDINTSSSGNGNAGKIFINTEGALSLDSSRIFTSLESTGAGTGGDINIQADSVSLKNFSFIDTATFGTGNAGSVDIKSNQTISLSNGSNIFSITAGQGNGGGVSLNAGSEISLTDRSNISTAVAKNRSRNGGDATSKVPGNGGNVTIAAPILSLRNGSQIQALTQTNSKAGNVTINASQAVIIEGTSFNSASTPTLFSKISTNDSPEIVNEQESNNLPTSAQALNDFQSSKFNPDVDFSTTIPYVSVLGNVSNLQSFDYYSFNATAGTRAIFDIDTNPSANSATPTAKIAEIALLDEKGLPLSNRLGALSVNNSAPASLGSGGSLADRKDGLSSDPYLRYTFTESGTYLIRVKGESNGKYTLQVSLDSPNVGGIPTHSKISSEKISSGIFVQALQDGQAGNLNIAAKQIVLNQGVLSAETSKSGADGANIVLKDVKLLLMLNRSLISAKATGDADGGNVTISAPNGLVATSRFSDSDIFASAFRGKGGNVNITAQSIFGLQQRREDSRLSDIVVSSRFGLDGNFISSTGIDPTSGLTQALREPRTVDVAENCQVSSGKEAVQFFDIGRGGLPPRPEDPLSIDLLEWISSPNALNPIKPQQASIFSTDRASPSSQIVTNVRLLPPCQSR